MSGKKASQFRPRNVPVATFEMFSKSSGQSQPVAEPATTMAQRIPDKNIPNYFRDLSKAGLAVRTEAFNNIIEAIKDCKKQEVFDAMIGPCCAVFDNGISDYIASTRIKAVNMMDELTKKMKKEQLAKEAGSIFPRLVFYVFDSDREVSEIARELLKRYFEQGEKQILMFSKMRREIALRIKAALRDLADCKWPNLQETEKEENWGRICSATLLVAANLLRACKLASDVFSAMGEIPVLGWLKPVKGQFDTKMGPTARSSAYLYLILCIQGKFIGFPQEKIILELLKMERAPQAQDKVLKLATMGVECGAVDCMTLQNEFLKCLNFYYQPEKVRLAEFLQKIGDITYIQKCIATLPAMTDIVTSVELFNCLIKINPEALPHAFVMKLFENAVAEEPPSKFYSRIPLDAFVMLKDNSQIDAILAKGDEARAFSYLTMIGSDRSREWLKERSEITPTVLTKIIKANGAAPIRNTWPTLQEIPIKVTKKDDLVGFILLFSRSDEIPYVVEKWPECLPSLLNRWTGDFSCFRCDKLLEITPDLLAIDITLIRLLFAVFPGNEELTKIITQEVKRRLFERGEFDPDICTYFKPSNDLLDAVLLSDAVEILESGDAIVKELLRRISEAAGTMNPLKLAKAAAKLIQVTSLDPLAIAVSPIDEPIFCYEFWNIIGFDQMNQIDFCFLLNAYIEGKVPWTSSLLYMQNVDWKFIPPRLSGYIRSHPNLAIVAKEQKLTNALACICHFCNQSLGIFGEKISGTTLMALSSEKPPPSCAVDNIGKVICSEWNYTAPELPDFTIRGETDLLLRKSIAYLQHYLPVVEEFDDFVKLAEESVGSESKYTFFLTLRLLSLIYDADYSFDVENIMRIMVSQIVKFETFPQEIEAELTNAFRIGRFLSLDQFEPFVLSISEFFGSKASMFLSRQIVPLISYFNKWDLVESRFKNKLDFDNIEPWYLITTAFLEMPFQKRLDLVPEYTGLLPPLFDRLDPSDPDFLMLISAFPSAAMRWFTGLPNSRSKPLLSAMDKKGTDAVFKYIANACKKLNLQCTTITEDTRNKMIHASYVEDETSVPVNLHLTFPHGYPFCQVKVHCEFGNEGEQCGHKVASAIIGHQSVEAGIKAWHQFVTYRLVDAEPCTVCYSYLNEEGKCPTVSCPTCGNKFHGKCLSTWFSKCLKPTCPYCASAWVEKKKK